MDHLLFCSLVTNCLFIVLNANYNPLNQRHNSWNKIFTLRTDLQYKGNWTWMHEPFTSHALSVS